MKGYSHNSKMEGYDSKMYSRDKKGYDANMDGHNPNEGENQSHYSDDRGAVGSMDSSGVGDGLSSIEATDVKNAEMVSQNQRPEGRRESAGSFTIGN